LYSKYNRTAFDPKAKKHGMTAYLTRIWKKPLRSEKSFREKDHENRSDICRAFDNKGLEDPTGKPDEEFVKTIYAIEKKILQLKRQLGQ